MNRRVIVVAALIAALMVVLFAFVTCSKDDDDDKDNGKDGKTPPQLYDMTIYGWGFGDSLYQYQAGQWNVDAATPFSNRITGSAFFNRAYGFVWGQRVVYRYNAGAWQNLTPPGMPTADIVDGVFLPDGSFWVAANDALYNGYLVCFLLDGSANIIPVQGAITSNPMYLVALFPVPEDQAIHLVGVVDGWYQHLRWDGSTVTPDPIFQVQYIEVGADDDDDTAADDDTSADDDDDDDDSSPVYVPAAQILDAAQAADGSIWAAGYSMVEGEKRGTMWHRGAEATEWASFLLTPTTGCKTNRVRRLYFTADGAGLAIADCLYSQIYEQVAGDQWTEASLPGVKGDKYVLEDIGLVDKDRGWAVGYTSDFNEPLFLMRSTEGWQQARFIEGNKGDHLYAVTMFDIPDPGLPSDDDSATDDDTSPADDDAADDDTSPPPADDDAAE